MDTRAFRLGFKDGRINEEENTYVRENKRIEYETGFSEGLKQFSKRHIKNKPQLFHNTMTNHNKKRMTISITDGVIHDVVRENTDCELVIHDYDIDGIDPESNIHCKKDENGKWYQKVIVD